MLRLRSRRHAHQGRNGATTLPDSDSLAVSSSSVVHADRAARAAQARREAEFASLVADFKAKHFATGHKTKGVVDPVQPPDTRPAPRWSEKTIDRWQAITAVWTIAASFGSIWPFTGAIAGETSWWLLAGTGTLAVTGAFGAWRVEVAHNRRRNLVRPLPKRNVTARGDVVKAYTAFMDTVPRLRAVDASEVVVAEIEAQAGYAIDLLHEAARLHKADASTSTEAEAVRDTIIAMAAHAQALAVLAERQHKALAATAAADPLLLNRAPDLSGFATLTRVIADEDSAARGALAAASRDPSASRL